MEIIDEEDEEIKKLMIRISRKEITLCETCDAFFDYKPQKLFCDECGEERERERKLEHNREYSRRPEVKERRRKQQREYNQRPEVKERNRERGRKRYQRPEYREQQREYYQRPGIKERRSKYRREYRNRPEVKERERQREREYRQRPEVRERRRKSARERYHRLKKLREEEWFLLDGWIWSRITRG